MKVVKKILDVMFPPDFTCDICGRETFNGKNLCDKCAETVIFNDGNTCPVCGRKTNVSELCLECKEQAPLFDRAYSALIYSLGARTLILKFKEGKPYLKHYFARLMFEKCAGITDADAICFVPMLRAAEFARGYNQSKLLAAELSAMMKLPLLKNAVAKVKKTEKQKKLTRKEREQNLKSCFKADKAAVEGKTLIVVDDVLTTGATADAVCGELKKQGAKKLYFVTVASVEYNAVL